MARQITPSLNCIKNEFDYRAYKEQQNQLDRVEWAISKQTASIIAGSRNVAEVMGEGVSEVRDGIREINVGISQGLSKVDESVRAMHSDMVEGFQIISIDLQKISVQVDDLSETISSGLSDVVNTILVTNARLFEIKRLIETPAQVWAREQYENALTCLRRQLPKEALEYVNFAINGDENHPGFKIDPEFHFLVGTLLAGDHGVEEVELDLSAARQAFESAARYAQAESPEIAKHALSRAAWCAYLQGDPEMARKLWEKSVSLNIVKFPEAEFLLSRLLLELGEVETMKPLLVSTIKNHPLIGFRAENDTVFREHISLLHDCLVTAHAELHKDLTNWINQVFKLELVDKLIEIDIPFFDFEKELHSVTNSSIQSARKDFRKSLAALKLRRNQIPVTDGNLSIVDMVEFRDERYEVKKNFKNDAKRHFANIDKFISCLSDDRPEPDPPIRKSLGITNDWFDNAKDGVLPGALLGGALAVSGLFIYFWWVFWPSEDNIFEVIIVAVFGGLLLLPMGAVLGAVVGAIVGAVVAFAINQRKFSQEKIQLDNEYAHEQAQFQENIDAMQKQKILLQAARATLFARVRDIRRSW